jgi:hypothetical protein
MSGNIDAVLENFTDDSVVFTPDGMVRGLAAIRRDTESFFATTPPEMMEALKIDRRDVDGEVAYLLWKAEPFVSLAAETFLMRDEQDRCPDLCRPWRFGNSRLTALPARARTIGVSRSADSPLAAERVFR